MSEEHQSGDYLNKLERTDLSQETVDLWESCMLSLEPQALSHMTLLSPFPEAQPRTQFSSRLVLVEKPFW